jgi:hypothetical protein
MNKLQEVGLPTDNKQPQVFPDVQITMESLQCSVSQEMTDSCEPRMSCNISATVRPGASDNLDFHTRH